MIELVSDTCSEMSGGPVAVACQLNAHDLGKHRHLRPDGWHATWSDADAVAWLGPGKGDNSALESLAAQIESMDEASTECPTGGTGSTRIRRGADRVESLDPVVNDASTRTERMAKGRDKPKGLGAVLGDLQATGREEQVRSYGADRLGFSGEQCSHCGSMQTQRVGKCIKCLSCGQDGECG